MEEKWVKLRQYNIPEGDFYVTDFVQNADGTKIILDDERTMVEVFFDGIPLLTRTALENVRMRTWSVVQRTNQDKFIFTNFFFFEVKNSKLIKWVIEESCGFYDESKLKHYSIVTVEEIIDVVATFEPIVKVSSLPETKK